MTSKQAHLSQAMTRYRRCARRRHHGAAFRFCKRHAMMRAKMYSDVRPSLGAGTRTAHVPDWPRLERLNAKPYFADPRATHSNLAGGRSSSDISPCVTELRESVPSVRHRFSDELCAPGSAQGRPPVRAEKPWRRHFEPMRLRLRRYAAGDTEPSPSGGWASYARPVPPHPQRRCTALRVSR